MLESIFFFVHQQQNKQSVRLSLSLSPSFAQRKRPEVTFHFASSAEAVPVMNFLRSNPSRRPLIPPNSVHPSDIGSGDPSARPFFRDASNLTTDDIRLPDLLDRDGDVGEQTLYQVEIVNEKLLRKSKRSQLASKNKCLTRRWQTALISTLLILGLAGGIGQSQHVEFSHSTLNYSL